MARWDRPDYVRTQARERLGWVVPGETGYRVVDANGKPLGGGAEITADTPEPQKPQDAWWDKLWGSVEAADKPAPVKPKPKPAKPITDRDQAPLTLLPEPVGPAPDPLTPHPVHVGAPSVTGSPCCMGNRQIAHEASYVNHRFPMQHGEPTGSESGTALR